MTAEGLRPLERGEIRSEGGELPGMVVPLAVVAATGRSGQPRKRGMTGQRQGAAERTAKEIAAQLRTAAEEQGWI